MNNNEAPDTATVYCTFAQYRDGAYHENLALSGYRMSSMNIVGRDKIALTCVRIGALVGA